jgi:signal transduction histidine kinase
MRRISAPRQAQVLGLTVLSLLLFAALVFAHRFPLPPDVRITAPLFAESLDEYGQQPVRLPHGWRTGCADCQTAWYRIPLHLESFVDDRWSVYIESVGMNAAVYANGELIGQGGGFADPTARFWNRPLLLPLPGSALRAGDNAIFVLVKADPPGSGHLGRVAIGPAGALEGRAAFRHLLKPGYLQFTFISTMILGLLMTVVWGYRRRERLYGWFALATLAGAASQLDLFVIQIPFASRLWELWIAVAGALSVAAFTAFLGHLLGRSMRLEAVAAWVLLASAVPVVLWLPAGGIASGAWRVAVLLLIIALGARLMVAALKHADAINAWLALPGSLLILVAARDIGHAVGIVGLGHGPYLAYAAPVVVGGFSFALIGRFLSNLRGMELLNADLKRAVREKTHELETQFRRVQALERDVVLVAERERLMRDMHDGIGGTLVATLAMLERGVRDPNVLSVSLRQALDDLRLMIDSLDPIEDDLNAVLAMLRDRMAPHLESAGIALDWRVGELAPVPGLGPARVLQILRVLQEAISNVLRHAGATRVTVSAGRVPGGEGVGRLRIEVRDNGRGFEPSTVAARGRGLPNLRRRAAELGAELAIHSTAGRGSIIRLELPASFAEP